MISVFVSRARVSVPSRSARCLHNFESVQRGRRAPDRRRDPISLRLDRGSSEACKRLDRCGSSR
uniref:Protein Aborting Lytic Development n=1 Tax=Arthrobacter phage phi AAU2 TaxID=50892 RepID=O21964_9CAUD|nr:protein Aborting Lytic Development [Arthrobacter phage phi AAU2]